MQITYTACDRCGDKDASGFGLNVGRYSDAAGSGADISIDADLCTGCRALLFSVFVNWVSVELAEDFLRELTAKDSERKLFIEHRG